MAKTIRALLAALAACVLLMGCPPAIVREALVYAEDDIAPSITVSSPANRSSFDSSVTFIGTVVDSAATTGDGEGKVRSPISYTVQDHESLSGTAEVQTDGAFAFTIDTHELSGDQTVIITAVDWNGNASSIDVELSDPKVGPDISVASPTEGGQYDSLITVIGVVNNRGDSVSTTEVASLTYQVLGEAASGSITYSETDGSFAQQITTAEFDGTVVIRLTARDKNGRTSTEDLTLTDRSTGPTLTITSTATSYQVSVTVTGTVTDNGSTTSTSEVQSLAYQVIGTAVSNDNVAFTAGTGAFSFTFSTVSPTLMDGTIVVRVTAADKNGRITTKDIYLSEVTDGPYLTISSPADGGKYGASVTLSGNVRDSQASATLSDVKSLTYRIGSNDPTPLEFHATTGAFSAVLDTFLYTSTIVIKVTATDLHNHSTIESITLTSNIAPPQVSITGYPAAYSSAVTADITVTGTVTSPATLKNDQMTFKIWNGSKTTQYGSDLIPPEDIDDDTGAFTFSFEPLGWISGNLVVTVIAVDEGDRQTEKDISISDDPVAPNITAASSIANYGMAPDNSYVDVQFTEAVYTAGGGTGALTAADLALVFTRNGGTATAASMSGLTRTDGGALQGGETIVRAALTLTGSPSGVEKITVTPASGSAIFDALGNPMPSGATTGLIPINDLTAPPTPGLPDLATADDTGASNSDNITYRISALTFSVTVGDAGTARLYVDGVESEAQTAPGAGTVTFDDISLSAGTRSVTATLTDASGNESAHSTPITVVVDTSASAPSASPDLAAADDLGSSSIDNLTSLTSGLTFSVTVSEAGTVTLYRATSVSLGTVTAAAAGTVSIDASLAAGTHSITAALTDVAGNVSLASPALPVEIDATAPSAPTGLDLATADDLGSSSTDNITSVTSGLTFSATAAEAGTVTLYVDGSQVDTETASGASTVTFTDIELASRPATPYSITATLTDAAGNTSSASTALNVTIDTAVSAPGTPDLATADDLGTSSSDNLTCLTSGLTFSVTVAEAGTVTLYRATTVSLGTATASAAGTVTIDASLSAGPHQITATLTDVAGNLSAASSPLLSVEIDETDPSAPTSLDLATADDLGDSDSDDLTSQTTGLTFSVEVTEAGIATLRVDGSVADTETASAAGTVTFTDIALASRPATPYSITATLTDAAGNVSDASTPLSVTIDAAAAAPTGLDLATADDLGSSSTDNITSVTSGLTFSATVAEAGTVTLYVDGSQVDTETASGASTVTFTDIPLTSRPATPYSITATLTDAAGNTSSASTALNVTIDTAVSAPGTPDLATADDLGTSSSDNLTCLTSGLTFSVSVGEAGTVTLRVDGTAADTETASAAGTVTFDDISLSAGTYSITARLTDVAGNTSLDSGAVSLQIETTDPSAPTSLDLATADDLGDSDSDDITSRTTGLTFSVEVTEAGIATLRVDGSVADTETASAAGTVTFTDIELASRPATPYSITATLTDAAGNVSDASTPLSVTIDAAVSAPSTPDLDDADDTGANDDDTTQTTDLTFWVTPAEPGTVTLYVDSVEAGSTQASTTDPVSIDIDLSVGTYQITATLTDVAGNVSAASTALSLTVSPP